MDYPIHIDRETVSMESSIWYFKGLSVNFFIKWYISVTEDCFHLASNADPDEMLHFAAFHLGLHCLPKYLFISSQNEKGKQVNFVC